MYLLESILDDLKTDEEVKFEKKDDQYIFTSTVNYPNNPKLVKQKIFMDADYTISEVQVLDKDNNIQIKMLFSKTDLKAKFDDDYFDLDELIQEKEENELKDEKPTTDSDQTEQQQEDNVQNTEPSEENTQNTATIDDIIYPMYLPENTQLTNQETIDTETGQRLILTFDGDNPFMLIEETVSYNEEHMIIPTYGELELLVDTVGVVNDNSVNWISNDVEYYVVSSVLSTSELLKVARSISALPVSK